MCLFFAVLGKFLLFFAVQKLYCFYFRSLSDLLSFFCYYEFIEFMEKDKQLDEMRRNISIHFISKCLVFIRPSNFKNMKHCYKIKNKIMSNVHYRLKPTLFYCSPATFSNQAKFYCLVCQVFVPPMLVVQYQYFPRKVKNFKLPSWVYWLHWVFKHFVSFSLWYTYQK